MKMRTEPVDYDLPMHVAQERLMKAIRDGREGYVTDDLARLNSGTIPADKVEGLFTPDEITVAVARRRKKLIEELRDLDRLVPNARRSSIVSGDKKVATTADAETGSWADLADYDAREMGGDGRTKGVQRNTRFERSLQALRDAAELLK
jgi:hypothetical protein